jgi:hypothetical protein
MKRSVRQKHQPASPAIPCRVEKVVVVSGTQPQDVLSGRGGGREKNANPAFREFGQTRTNEIRQSRGEDAPITDRDRKEIVDDWLRDHPDCRFLKRVWIDAGREEGERKINELALDLNRQAKKKKKKKSDRVQGDDGWTTEQRKDTSQPSRGAAPSSSACDNSRSDEFAPDLQQDMVDCGEPMLCKRPKLYHMETGHKGYNHPAGASDTSLDIHHNSIDKDDGVFAGLAVVPKIMEARTAVEGPLDGWDFAPNLFDYWYDPIIALGLSPCSLQGMTADGYIHNLLSIKPPAPLSPDNDYIDLGVDAFGHNLSVRSVDTDDWDSIHDSSAHGSLDGRILWIHHHSMPGMSYSLSFGSSGPLNPSNADINVDLGATIDGCRLALLVLVVSARWVQCGWRSRKRDIAKSA